MIPDSYAHSGIAEIVFGNKIWELFRRYFMCHCTELHGFISVQIEKFRSKDGLVKQWQRAVYAYCCNVQIMFYLSTRESLIGHSRWALPHYTEMGHSSSIFEAPPVPAGVRTHDLPFRWSWTYQKATGESVHIGVKIRCSMHHNSSNSNKIYSVLHAA